MQGFDPLAQNENKMDTRKRIQASFKAILVFVSVGLLFWGGGGFVQFGGGEKGGGVRAAGGGFAFY